MVTDLRTSELLPPNDWDPDALKFYEVAYGEFVQKPSPGASWSVLAGFLQGLMGPFARANGLGRVVIETLFFIDHGRVLMRRPTLAFVSEQRWHLKRRVPQTEAWDVVPDLAAEVINQSTRVDEVVIKIEEYFQAGVRAVWVVFPAVNKVYVFESPTQVRILQIGDTLEGGDLLPGFQVALSTLFEEGGEEPEPAN